MNPMQAPNVGVGKRHQEEPRWHDNEGFPDEAYIQCLGKDNKRHICLPWKDKTLCGVPVKSKSEKFIRSLKGMETYQYSCYECTY